jgi:hypothetical protein
MREIPVINAKSLHPQLGKHQNNEVKHVLHREMKIPEIPKEAQTITF